MLPLQYIVAGDIYRDPQMDLQLPGSHLAFRTPAGFTGQLSADGAFELFSADRKLSCFVFVHSADKKLPTNWMTATLALDGKALIAAGEQQHAQSDTAYRRFEGAEILAYKFLKTNRQGAGLHGSAAALQSGRSARRISQTVPLFASPWRTRFVGDASPRAHTSAQVTARSTFCRSSARPAANRAVALFADFAFRLGLEDYLPLPLFSPPMASLQGVANPFRPLSGPAAVGNGGDENIALESRPGGSRNMGNNARRSHSKLRRRSLLS